MYRFDHSFDHANNVYAKMEFVGCSVRIQRLLLYGGVPDRSTKGPDSIDMAVL